MAEQDVVNAARARWRADLNEFGAAGHEAFGDQVNADAKRAEAENLRREADLSERYVAAKEAKDELQLDALAQELREHRRQWRSGDGEAGRGVVRLSVINNFEEPSDEDHLAAAAKGGSK